MCVCIHIDIFEKYIVLYCITFYYNYRTYIYIYMGVGLDGGGGGVVVGGGGGGWWVLVVGGGGGGGGGGWWWVVGDGWLLWGGGDGWWVAVVVGGWGWVVGLWGRGCRRQAVGGGAGMRLGGEESGEGLPFNSS